MKITGYLAFLMFGSVDIWTCACNPEWEEGAIGWLEYELPRQPSFLIVIAHWRTGKILPRQWNFANSSVLASLITNPFSSWIYQRIIVRLLFSADFKCLNPYFFLQESCSSSTLACNTFVMFKLCRVCLHSVEALTAGIHNHQPKKRHSRGRTGGSRDPPWWGCTLWNIWGHYGEISNA